MPAWAASGSALRAATSVSSRYSEGDQVEDAGCAVGFVVAADDVPGRDGVAPAVVAEDAGCRELGYRVPGHVGWYVVGLGELSPGDLGPGLQVTGRGPHGDRRAGPHWYPRRRQRD